LLQVNAGQDIVGVIGMAQDVFVVAYDGRDQHVVDVAIDYARKQDAQLLIVYVLEWSPFGFLTPTELADRHQQREKDLARAQESIIVPILEKIRESGITVEAQVGYGNAVDLICATAKEKNATMIFIHRSSSLSARIFGSVATGVVQGATVPTVVVP